MTVVWIDTETTGLDDRLHEIWELSYAIDYGPIETLWLPHSLRNADPRALEMNHYWDEVRDLADPEVGVRWQGFLSCLPGATLAGANPAFDARFLRARIGDSPWHHRLLDVEAYVAGVLRWDTPRGLKSCVDEMRYRGYTVTESDHHSANDVAAARDVYRAAKVYQGRCD